MAITQAVCTSFKQEILKKEHDVEDDTLKIALYTDSATLNATTTAYSTTNEITGTGYTAGGETLTNVAVSADGVVAIIDFDDPEWTGATFTARGALVYNSSVSDKAIAVIDFGANRTIPGGTFTINIPNATASQGIIKIN